MILFVTFFILFVGGPLIFRQLMRMEFGQRFLGLLVVIFMLVGIGLRYGFEDLWGDDLWLTMMSFFLIWMAWIVVLGLGAHALCKAVPGKRTVRWTSMIGAVGTTVPWFGLASASWIEG